MTAKRNPVYRAEHIPLQPRTIPPAGYRLAGKLAVTDTCTQIENFNGDRALCAWRRIIPSVAAR
jgi:hypothetical protein